MLDRVKEALAAIRSEGAFAAEHACPSDDLDIEVKGVGALRFPISATTVRALCATAQPAPFGRRDKTLRDRSVRDTWEIGKSRIKIDARAWKRTLDPTLARLREKLGLPNDGKLVAVLDKMLVYTPGQFFAAHQDSERDDDMVGSLVVQLPSASSGGAVIVHHHGEKKIFHGAKRGPKDLSLLAFYADCHHEVKPIASGYRVVLTYHVLHRAAASPRAPVPQSPAASAAVDDLAESVKAYFSTPVAHGYGNPAPQLPDRLIYLLDHEYTEKSLAWTRLKNGDRLRVGALRQIAERLDCESYLVLADVHENWTCEEDDSDYYGWRGRRHHRDEVNGDESSEHELGELCDTSVELRHWVGHDGHTAPSVPVTPAESEICFTKASVELDPFKSEHEGNMGNYGNTVDRWYHRAAIVMWPRDRDFVIRAKVSPSSAVNELAARLKARALPEARDGARSLLPFWARHAPKEESKTFFTKLLQVVLSLDDAELAHGLLAPFGPDRLSPRALPAFATLVERCGLAWSQRVFATWSERVRYDAPPWLPLLPELVEALLTGAPGHGREFAAWLLARELNAFEQARIASLRLPAIWLGGEKTGEHSETLLALLKGAAVIDAVSTRNHLITLLTTGKTALPILDAGALLETCRKGRTPAAVRALELHTLYRHVVDALERTLAAPARAVDDWSIELPMGCKCELCTLLSAFLRDRTRVEHAWPLPEARRRHIHDGIGRHHLPVTHATTRRGRPYSLVLTKQKALFEREAALRAQQERLLGWLKKHRDAFVGPQPTRGASPRS
jgi:hypothetical protein